MRYNKRVFVTAITVLLVTVLSGCAAKMRQPETQPDSSRKESAESSPAGTEPKKATDKEADTSVTSAGNTEEDVSVANTSEETENETESMPAVDFTLNDQYGNTHTLSDYKGRVVFLNFWATWCPPCRAEMPDIQKLYREYEEAGDDSVVILGVAAPGLGQEKDIDGITAFLEENGYTYPVVMDETGDVFLHYYVYSYPTTYMIDKEGNVFGYLTGSMPESTMRSIIEQTLSGVRE